MVVAHNVSYNYLLDQFYPQKDSVKAILRDIEQELYNCQFTLGGWVERFEEAICEKYGCKHCIGVNSGTDALILALLAVGVGPGDTVLTISNTFVATVGAICAVGATPRFVDVDVHQLMNLEKAAHRRVKCAIPVHLTGLAVESNLWENTIYDAAQAIGASWQGKNVACFDGLNCFSLHPLKNLNVWGDGGFITTNNDDLAKILRLLRNHGLETRDRVVIPGRNSRLDNIQAIVAWHGLKEIDWINHQRRLNAAIYEDSLQGLWEINTPKCPEGASPVYHTYVCQAYKRDELVQYLATRGIEAKVHYPVPVHRQPGYQFLGYKERDLPHTEYQAERIISLPIHQYLDGEDILYVSEVIKEFYEEVRRNNPDD